MDYSIPGFPVPHYFQSLPKSMSIESVMSSNHLILCRLILLPSIRVFSNVPVRCSHHLLRSDGQSIGASASASVLPMSIQCWFPLGLTGMIFLLFKGLSRVFSSTIVQFSCSVMSDSLWPHDPQHARPPCPSPTPGVHLNLCPLSLWCHPANSSSVVPFSSCPQSFPASGSFPMSQLFALGGQSIGASASASVLSMNIQDWSPLGWTGWISLQSKGLSRVFSNTTVEKHQFFGAQLSLWSNSHIHTWQLEKP